MDSVIMSAEEEITQEELIDKIKSKFFFAVIAHIKHRSLSNSSADKCLDSDLFINKRNEMQIHLKFSDAIHIKSKGLKTKDIWFRLSLDSIEDQTDDQSNGFKSSDSQTDPIEVAVLKDNECLFRPQEPNGRLYNPKEYVLFRTKVTEIEEMVNNMQTYDTNELCVVFRRQFSLNCLLGKPIATQNGSAFAIYSLRI